MRRAGVAQQAPSNCNVQPWRLFVASAAAHDRLRPALLQAINSGELPDAEDALDTFPGDYRRLQIECAVALYREMGITREDSLGRMRAMARNFEFFDAPHVAIVCMEKQYGVRVALDVGAYVQTLLLALWSRGIASCASQSEHIPHDHSPRAGDSKQSAALMRRLIRLRRSGGAGQPHPADPRADYDQRDIRRRVTGAMMNAGRPNNSVRERAKPNLCCRGLSLLTLIRLFAATPKASVHRPGRQRYVAAHKCRNRR